MENFSQEGDYKLNRRKNKLVFHWGALDIVCTEDEEQEGWDYIDIVYADTDCGLGYEHIERKDYLEALSRCEAYAMGYNKALEDLKSSNEKESI